MAFENVEKFEDLLRGSEELQAKMRAAADAYEGDKADEQAIFEAVIAPLAEEAGLPFSLEEGREFVISSRELTDDELDAVAGGKGGCYVIGGGKEADACTDDILGAGACYAMGVGIFKF